MLSIIFGTTLLFNSSNSFEPSLPEKCDVWSQVSQYYTDGHCPNTRPYCDTREPEQSH